MSTQRPCLLFTVPTAILFLAATLLANTTAILTGRVTDGSGAVIVGVKVEARNTETNVSFLGETNAEGLFTIPDLPPGIYSVTVQKPTFQTIVKPGVELRTRDIVPLNFAMEIGAVTESITVEAGAPLIQFVAGRGGNFTSRQVRDLPLVGLNPISLGRTLPGVLELPGSFLYGTGLSSFSVNGQRFRSNNYLLDGTENNDIVYTGVAQPFNIADAIEEVAVQTGNFGVESGRAGGGIFNIVTKSGTNNLHGTALWRYQSQRFNSVSNLSKSQGIPKSVFSRNVYGFTLGGPIRKGKTFFFGGFQEDSLRSRKNFPLTVPTEATLTRLRSLFPSNPRLDLYLRFLGDLRGTASPTPLQLGIDPQTGVDRGLVQFASAAVGLPASEGGPQWLARVDHNLSVSHRLAFRYISDSRRTSPLNMTFPGFVTDSSAFDGNFLFTDHYTFSPMWTNEFRFSYARQESQPQRISPESVPEAQDLPRISIPSISTLGGINSNSQYSKANNLLFPGDTNETQGTSHIPIRLRVLKTDSKSTPSVGENGRSDLQGCGGLLRIRQLSGQFQRTVGPLAKRL
jgi:Carboxypeptidase regulatory-like domain